MSLWAGLFLERGRFGGGRSSQGSKGLSLKPAVTAVTGVPRKPWGPQGCAHLGSGPAGDRVKPQQHPLSAEA